MANTTAISVGTNDIPKTMSLALADSGVIALLEVLKLSDEEAYAHSYEVGRIVALVLEEMGKKENPEFCAEIAVEIVKGALLSDVGKAFLPFGIQHSSVGLDTCLSEIVKMHPILGYIAVRDGSFSEVVKNIVLYHHASADGSGYPKSMETGDPMVEENTPPYVWIVGYADRFDAMTGERKFKSSLSYRQAWDELNNLRQKKVLPYRYAKYFHKVIKKLDIFDEF